MLLADPGEIQRFGRSIDGFVEELRAGLDGLFIALRELGESWDDDNHAVYVEEFSEAARMLDAASEVFLEQRRQLELLVGQMEEIRLGGTPEPQVVGGAPIRALVTGKSRPPSRAPVVGDGLPPSRAPVAGGGCAVVGLHAGRPVLSAEALRDLDSAARIDWGDPDFAVVFRREHHHGWTAKDYLTLAGQLPAALSGVSNDATEAFLSAGDPIHLTLRQDGYLEVIDGRHRLMAAMIQGVPAPVSLVLPALSADGALRWHHVGSTPLPLRDLRRAMVSDDDEANAIVDLRSGRDKEARGVFERAQLPLQFAAAGLAARVQTVLPGAVVTVSVKDPESLAAKLLRNHRDGSPHYGGLSEIGDRLRLEAIVPPKDIAAAVAALRKRFIVRRVRASGASDRVGVPVFRRPSGYSGVHVAIEEGGEMVEIQLHTPAEHSAWLWSHPIYKDPVWSRDRRMQAFSRAWWAHLIAREDGRPSPPPTWPEGLPTYYRPQSMKEFGNGH